MKKPLFLIFCFLVASLSLYSQESTSVSFTEKFINVKDHNIHYLDFGGEGIPVILIPSGTWNAEVYRDFGPFLNDNNQVFAITMPGYGKSEGDRYDVPSQGDYLIGFLDALKLEKAVFIGNSSATAEITYLAENYPNRVAGVVYLSGLSTPWVWDIMNEKDPHQTNKMYTRYAYSEDPIDALNEGGKQSNSRKNKAEEILAARSTYRPKHFTEDIIINVPALFFTNKDGRLGYEKDVAALLVAGSPLMDEVRQSFPPSPFRDDLDRRVTDPEYRAAQFDRMKDSSARAFFYKLAADTVMQREVLDFQIETVYPALIAAQDRMKKAFGANAQLVKLDTPIVVDYAYRDAPELILGDLIEFLKELD
ncbi:alpha/beta fold hydrolase [Algoriphagus hitonicola]|uniref:Alpha/beta hydrolase fold n=1 Tax=Algoriphagus hitonicola TaxID=435880 RepID=A0A1I2QHU6_9BACT|nr:alpha/beta hydrolase [Algoriphagus hitonicola]SFG25306.1 alpha/beta hydrolase fold [Algoriphagus hitonicola]